MRYVYRAEQKGFTLLEALVAVAIVAMMSMFSYATLEYFQRTQVKAEAVALGDFLKYAYGEARRRGEVLLICPAEYNAAGEVTGCAAGMTNGFYPNGGGVWNKGLVLYRANKAATSKADIYTYASDRKIADFPVSSQFEIAGGGADPGGRNIGLAGSDKLDTMTANRVLAYDAMGVVAPPLAYGRGRRGYGRVDDTMTAFVFTVRKKGTALDAGLTSEGNIKNKMCYEVNQRTNGAVTTCYTYEQRGSVVNKSVACACANDAALRTDAPINFN